MKRYFFGLASLVCAIACAPPLRAATVNFDSSLAGPAGFYNGTGGVNNGFTVVTTDNGNLELGLRASQRQNPADIATPGSNVYNVPLGFQTDVTSGGAGGNPARGAWGVEFSINSNVTGGSGGLTLSDLVVKLAETGPNGTFTVNPLTFYTDDAAYGPGGKATGPLNPSVDWGAQNSENEIFAPWDINPNLAGTYTFTLSVIGPTALTSGTDTIIVTAGGAAGAGSPTPLPASSTAGMVLFAVLGLGAGVRRYWRRGTIAA